MLVGAPRTSSSLNIRRDLHWLPVGHRITYKLSLTTWKTLHTSQPLYLSELISHYLPSRSLRSSNTNLLTRPDGITSNFSSRAFSVSAPSTNWNSLPAHIRSIDTLSAFKRHLKFHLLVFQSAFTVYFILCQRLRFVLTILTLYKFVCMYCMYVCSPIILFIHIPEQTYFCCYWLQLMPPFLSAPKAPNRSAVNGLAAAARKRKAAG